MEQSNNFAKIVKITLSSVQYSEPEIELFTDDNSPFINSSSAKNGMFNVMQRFFKEEKVGKCIQVPADFIPLTASADTDPVRIKYSCNAALSKNGDVVTLSYSEPSADDLTGGKVSVRFTENSLDKFFIERSGQGNVAFILIENTLCEADYNTPYGAFKMRAFTVRLKNQLSESGGALIFEYVSQLEKLEAQRIKMRIEVKREKTN